MNIRRRTKVALLFAGLLAVASTANARELRLVASVWEPYVSASMERNGVAPALVRAALRRAGYRVQLYIDDWPRSLTATEAGDFDGIVSLWYTAERGEALAFSEPFIVNRLQFMKRAADDIQLRRREDFVGLRVGVVEDFAYSEQQYDTSGIDIVSGGSVGANVQRLLDGELDLVLGDQLVLHYEADQRRAAKRVEVLPLVLESRALHLAISRKRPDYAEIVTAFDKNIAAMKADGTYNSMLANYRISN